MGTDYSKSGNFLCLDGGGIRGMVQTTILEYIENQTDRAIKDSFEWIAGTNTGGLMALYLALDHTATECMQLYKTMKNEIFGAKAYSEIVQFIKGDKNINAYERAVKDNTTNMERLLRQTFGETTKMSDIKDVKVIITATLGKQDPLELIHYTNFKENKDELVWKVARATTAAPGYFERFMIEEYGPLFDGGLTANNPTLTALSFIVNYYKVNSVKEPINMCLSVGTGVLPNHEVELPNLPNGAFDELLKWKSGELKTMTDMYTNEIARTNGHVIDEAKAFCSVGNIRYYRLNPLISLFIDLDETDDKKLDEMIEETNAYIKENNKLIDEIFVNS